jgi:hypothetical protein
MVVQNFKVSSSTDVLLTVVMFEIIVLWRICEPLNFIVENCQPILEYLLSSVVKCKHMCVHTFDDKVKKKRWWCALTFS